MKLEDFKKKNIPKRKSILSPFKSEILELYNLGYSLKSIQSFLAKNGVETSFQNLHKFIKKELKEEKPTNKLNKRKKELKGDNTEEKKTTKKKIEDERWGVKFSEDNVILKALEGDI